jgi:small-conductance mechanosensitive channel
VPGDYRVELAVGSEMFSAGFAIVKDPRLASSPEDHARQFALLKDLTDTLSKLNESVNRIRRIKRQLAALIDRLGGSYGDLAAKAKTTSDRLTAIENVLVDVNRQTPRDVLRNPAGLNDTLAKLFSLVAMSDTSPTAQAEAVSRGIIARVATEIRKLDALLAADVAEVNRMAMEQSVAHVAD